MGFSGTWVGFLTGVLLSPILAVGQNSVSVVVNNSGHVQARVLRNAETEAARLFQAAGISIRWLNCDQSDACRRPLLPSELVVHIVRAGKTQNDFVFGEAFLGSDGRGQYSDIFFDRIRAARSNTDVPRLLGVVIAHELGHLLLGSRAHSQLGIMQPVWEEDCVRKLGMGTLLFTPEQARLMKQRMDRDEPPEFEASSRKGGRF